VSELTAPGAGSGEESLSARERAYRYLRQAIVSGEVPAGTRIVEERVAEDLKVSRTPVREALQRLGSEGLLDRVRRGQLEVARIGGEAREELHLLRVAIDEVVARLLARKVERIDWPDLYARLDGLASVIDAHGPASPAYAAVHIDLHAAINLAAFSQQAGHLLGGRAGLYPTDDYVQQLGYNPVSQHRALLDELSSGDESRAVTAALAHAVRGRADGARGSGTLSEVSR
jgi:DNA-binding GntR family transcriptional regulator